MASLHYHKPGIGEIANQYGIEKDLLAQKIKEFSIDAASWITMLDHEGNIFVLKDMEALFEKYARLAV